MKEERGWLIERKDGNGSFTGEWLTIIKPANRPKETAYNIEWTTDSNIAIRFSRSIDAHFALALFMTVDYALNGHEPYYEREGFRRVYWKSIVQNAGISEHAWPAPRMSANAKLSGGCREGNEHGN